jgi:Ca2+-binding RTX toxin-like protein
MTIVSSDGTNLDMQAWTYRGLATAHLFGFSGSPTEATFQSNLDPYSGAAPDFELLKGWLKIDGFGFGDFDINGIPHSGTVTSFVVSTPAYPVLTVNPVNLPVGVFFAAIGSNDSNLLQNTLLGGDDLIDGGSQAILKIGFSLDDVFGDGLVGGPGNDTINGHGGVHDTLLGGAGDDLIAPQDAQNLSSATIDGGPGVDTVTYALAPGGVVADLTGGSGGPDTITGVERVIGSAFADHIIGGTGAETIMAGGGNDSIDGGAGANYLRGEDGDDSISGGSGFDDINGNKGDDTIDGGSGGSDWLVGGQGNDLITAHTGQNILYGNLGNDTLVGGNGGDVLRGGQGDDSIAGGAGNDFISGDRGNDTETGGAGADNFHGSQDAGIDRVLDFHLAEGDRVQLDPGTTYTVSQVGGDTVIDMGAGNEMILVGVQMSTLTPGWIFEG